MKKRSIGKPRNLFRPECARARSDESAFQLACVDDSFYGATLKNVGTPHPVFLECDELLGLAALIERNRAWLEEHAQANREWRANEIAGCRVLVRLRRRDAPDRLVALSLLTENHLAWYGTPIRSNASQADPPMGRQKLREYPKAEWEEYAVRQQFAGVK